MIRVSAFRHWGGRYVQDGEVHVEDGLLGVQHYGVVQKHDCRN